MKTQIGQIIKPKTHTLRRTAFLLLVLAGMSAAILSSQTLSYGVVFGENLGGVAEFINPMLPPMGSATGKIAFRSHRDGNAEIYLMNPDGSGQTRLTQSTRSNASYDGEPSFSLDGRRIAFCSTRDGSDEIYVMNADGTGQTRLTRDADDPDFGGPFNYGPSLSGDGSRIAFTKYRGENDEIYVMNADGTASTRLTDDAAFDIEPQFSADGSRIAFTSGRISNRDQIYIMNADGSAQTRLSNNNFYDFDPAISPDGQRIAFTSSRDNDNEIYIMNADGSGQNRLTNAAGSDAQPEFSPDGSSITFVSYRDGDDEIYIMNADGTGQVRITNSPDADVESTWGGLAAAPAPVPITGEFIAFDSSRDADGNSEIYMMKSDGTQQRRLTSNTTDDKNPDFSSDGSRIAFQRGASQAEQIWVMNPDGSGQTQLTTASSYSRDPAFSRDGSRIAFTSQRSTGGADDIYVMNANGTSQTRLTINSSFDTTPVFSPDGTRIAFQSDRDGNLEIYIMNADGSNQVNLSNSAGTRDYSPSFSPDGTRIIFISQGAPDPNNFFNSELFVMNADGTNRTKINLPAPGVFQPVFSPDGTRIAFTAVVGGGGFEYDIISANADGSNVSNITGYSTGLDFNASWAGTAPTAAPATISGSVTTPDGSPLGGALMRLSGALSRTTVTDSAGNYHFDNVDTSNLYSVTPSLANYSFAPASRSFSLMGNMTDAGFTANPDATHTANPLDTPEYFVRQHYLDFLGREPDESGFTFWSDQILECGTDTNCIERRRTNVSAAYFLSIEFQQTGGLVDGLYRASYGRRPLYAEFMPDAGSIARDVVVGRSGWEQQLATNKRAFVEAWVQRPSFIGAYANLTNDRFVDELIAHTGVTYSQTEREALLTDLTNGTLTRAAVLQRIAEDQRFVSAKFNEAFVMMEYFGYLRRDPDESGYQFWLAKLNQFNGNFEQAEMVKAFIVSGEYRARFVR